MKKECVAMLLAGGQGSRLYSLTSKAAKPIIPFGGKYRVIDFPLSNCSNSGIDVVGVLTQYQPLQLNSYIGSGQPWDLDLQSGGVYILPPYQAYGKKGGWFSGTANAIYKNTDFIDIWDPDYVLILSGDHIYKMDYSHMLKEHKQNSADCTIAVIKVSIEDASRFGIIDTNESGYISKFSEKPKKPNSNLASMGIYIFTWKKLREYLITDEGDPDSDKDFGKNIIPKMLAADEKLWPYRFDGYWRDIGTINSLWEANMDMLKHDLIDLYSRHWPIRSRSPKKPPQFIGESAIINNSIITEGCEIYGSVVNSVLGNSVTVLSGAKVENSVLMPGCLIGRDAMVSYSIIGENSIIGDYASVGSSQPSDKPPKISTCGPDSLIPPNMIIDEGAIIYSE